MCDVYTHHLAHLKWTTLGSERHLAAFQIRSRGPAFSVYIAVQIYSVPRGTQLNSEERQTQGGSRARSFLHVAQLLLTMFWVVMFYKVVTSTELVNTKLFFSRENA